MKASVETMLSDCRDVVDIPSERGGPGFSQWEQEFLESIGDQLAEGVARMHDAPLALVLVFLMRRRIAGLARTAATWVRARARR